MLMIEITMEGQFEQESDYDIFAELLETICKRHEIKFENFGILQRIEICPEGIITCSYEGKFISIVAQSNVAGPGFHAFAAKLFDDILLECGMDFEVHDQSGYFENRDFEALKYKCFLPWLQGIVDYVLEHKDQDKRICICWPVDEYQPFGRDDAFVTPMGYMTYRDLINEDLESLAERFFIWNHQERDAMYYRNCALCLMWKDCYFEYSLMNDHSDKIANMILDYLEAAYEADNLLELPYDEYKTLCEVVHREVLIHGESAMRNIPIGYRKDMIFYTLSHWSIPCYGCAEKNFDKVTQSLNFMAPYSQATSPWEWFMKVKEYENPLGEETFAKPFAEAQDVFDWHENGWNGKGYIEQFEDHYKMNIQINKCTSSLYLECVIREEKNILRIQEWCKRVIYLEDRKSVV